MKKAVVVSMGLVFVISFAQAKSCLVATNPSQAEIKSLSSAGAGTKSERVNSIEAVLEDAIPGNTLFDEVPASLTLKAKSKTMEFTTVAIHFEGLDEGTYIVECDGGTAKLTLAVNGYDINSKSLLGSIGNDSECGLSEAVIVLKNVNFEDRICAE